MTEDTRTPVQKLVTDPRLQPILATTAAAREAALYLDTLRSQPDPTPGTDAHALAISRAQKALITELAILRGQNREMHKMVRADKAETAKLRAEVDAKRLDSQNLQYESEHLKSQIAATEGYDHSYEKLDLVPEEVFLAQNPGWKRGIEKLRAKNGSESVAGEESVMQDAPMNDEEGGDDNAAEGSKKGKTRAEKRAEARAMKKGKGRAVVTEEEKEIEIEGGVECTEENLMRARINAEEQERLRLEEIRKLLVARKAELVRGNAKRKDRLQQMDANMETFLEVCEQDRVANREAETPEERKKAAVRLIKRSTNILNFVEGCPEFPEVSSSSSRDVERTQLFRIKHMDRASPSSS